MKPTSVFGLLVAAAIAIGAIIGIIRAVRVRNASK